MMEPQRAPAAAFSLTVRVVHFNIGRITPGMCPVQSPRAESPSRLSVTRNATELLLWYWKMNGSNVIMLASTNNIPSASMFPGIQTLLT